MKKLETKLILVVALFIGIQFAHSSIDGNLESQTNDQNEIVIESDKSDVFWQLDSEECTVENIQEIILAESEDVNNEDVSEILIQGCEQGVVDIAYQNLVHSDEE